MVSGYGSQFTVYGLQFTIHCPPITVRLICPGMGFAVGFAESGRADVGVDLRGHQAFVAEQFLHAADVGAAVEEMRGEAVAQRMRRGAGVEAGEFQVFFQHPGHAARGQAAAEFVDEHRGGRAGRFAGV